MMAIEELKKQLHNYIDLIDDEETLHMLNDAMAAYATEVDTNDELTPEQLQDLDRSLEEADRGEFISHEEVMKMSREWLKGSLK